MYKTTSKDTNANEIQASLAKVFAQLDGSYVKSSSVNRIILASVNTAEILLHNTIIALSGSQPGRFFLIMLDPSVKDLNISVSAQCHVLSKGESVCSEIITLQVNPSNYSSIPSILRANLLTGRRTELVLMPESNITELFDECAKISDLLIINSSYYWQHQQFMLKNVQKFKRVIDTQWLQLASWREITRNIFNVEKYQSQINNLNSIEISYSSSSHLAYLYAGWLAFCLKWHISSYSANRFECISKKGQSVNFKFNKSANASDSNIQKVLFKFTNFTNGSGHNTHEEVVAELVENKRLIVRSGSSKTAWLTESYEKRTSEEALSRYYTVGESTLGYAEILPIAIELCQLESGFI